MVMKNKIQIKLYSSAECGRGEKEGLIQCFSPYFPSSSSSPHLHRSGRSGSGGRSGRGSGSRARSLDSSAVLKRSRVGNDIK